MGRLAFALVVVSAAMLLAPASGGARTWEAALPFPGPVDPVTGMAALPGGGSLFVDHGDGGGLVARAVAPAGGVGPAQTLGGDALAQASVATSDAGDAVIAFDDWNAESLVVLARGVDGALTTAATFQSFASGPPVLALSPDGWAAVAFTAYIADVQRMVVAVRPPGGSFGPAEPAALTADSDPQTPAGLAIDDTGEVVLGYAQAGIAHAVLRSAGRAGAWQPPQALGAPPTDPRAADSPPEVGIDAAGGAVVIWLEGRPSDEVEPLRASFRPPGGSFGEPQKLLDSWSGAWPALAVSALGEAIVLVTPAVEAKGDISLQPFAVIYGSTALGRFGAAQRISNDVEDWPGQLTMNARGDAVAAWVRCCPGFVETHRRAPFGAFETEQDVALPATATTFSAGLLGPVGVDPFGNATLQWLDNSSLGGEDRAFAADAPVLRAAPAVVPPSPAALVDLVPVPVTAPVPVYAPFPFPFPLPVVPGPSAVATPSPSGSNGSGATDRGPFAVAVPRLPGATGTPRIVVAVHCPWACRASVSATLITPAHGRLALPRLALTADAPGVVSAALRLSPPAARALRVASKRSSAARRRFTLRLTVTAGDRSGVPQAASLTRGFVRR